MAQQAKAEKTAAEVVYDKKIEETPAETEGKTADTETPAEGTKEGEGKKEDEKPADPPADDKGEGEGKEKPAATDKAPDNKKDSETGKDGKGKETAKPAEKPLELKLPEGTTLEASHVDAVKAFAKEQGLSATQAQAILERDHQAVAASRQAIQEAHQKEAEGWVETLKKDKELGGKNFAATVDRANRFLNDFGDPEFKKELSRTLLGSHPGLVRLANRVMKILDDDAFIDAPRNAASKEGTTRAEDVIYDKTAKTSKGD
jgi:hypothetical protein